MSELTRCNRCTLNLIIESARRKGKTVTVIKDEQPRAGFMGVSVYVHDEDAQVDRENPVAWFAALTHVCAC